LPHGDIIATESLHSLSRKLSSQTTAQLVKIFIDEERNVEKALRSQADLLVKAVDLIHQAFRKKGRLIYVGAGTSGRLGVLDASEIPPTFGFPSNRVIGLIAGGKKAVFKSQEGAEDCISGAERELKALKLCKNDVVCGIAASGRTPYVFGALHFAKSQKAKTLLISCNPMRKKNLRVDVGIDFPTGPEIIAGSTRLKAGTATKVALNLLTSIAMIQLGRVQGGRMTHLHASNQKLQDRAIRNVMDLGKRSRKQSERLLIQNQWNIARVMELLQRP
jgi:N-acetylmuramic acid 6-phosphate etherase